MKHAFLPVCLLVIAGCAGTAVTAAQQDRLGEARRLLANDPDAALTITDELLRESPDFRAARVVAADGSLRLAALGRTNTPALLEDAARNFELALALDADDGASWLGLAEARYQMERFDEARQAAVEAARLLDKPGGNVEQVRRAHVLAARSQIQTFLRLRQDEIAAGKPDRDGFVKPEKATLAAAQDAMRLLIPVQKLEPGQGYPLAATVLRWLGQNDTARTELERGIRTAPEVAEIHLAYQDFYRGIGDMRALNGAYANFVREQAGQPTMLWFQGRAQVMLADDLRSRGSFQPAIEAYRRALDTYGRYRAMMPRHAEAADEWRAICEIAIARTCVDLGDLVSARQHLFAAADASPKVVEVGEDGLPLVLDSFRVGYANVLFAISRALSESGADALQKTLEFNEEVIRRHPGRWGFVYNNAALPARDLGVAIAQRAEREGATAEEKQAALAEAMALWEKSYRYYEEAVRLSPEDARIVNDCGLMLIYHLNRDFDRARELFERAIQVGQAELDALPADADPKDREFLEEAVGDAWQNIAVLLARHLQRPWEEVEPFCTQAVKYFPYQRREAAAMLRNRGLAEPAVRRQGRLDQGRADAGASAQDPQDAGPRQAMARVRREVDAKVKDGDLDGALGALDAHVKDLKDHAPFCALRGDLMLRYALQRREQGQTSGLEFLFADAVAQLKRAVELDGEPAAPRQRLGEAQYENGDLAEAVATASALLLHLQSQGGGAAADQAAAHGLRARAAARLYIAQKGEGQDRPDLLQDLRTSFRHLEQHRHLDQELRTLWATTEQWAGAPAAAAGIWARALAQSPDDQTLLATMADTAIAAGAPDVAIEALQQRTDAFGLWYLGKARFTKAHELYTGGDHKAALALLDTAQKDFEKSMAGNAAFTDSCQQWIAMCIGKQGCVAYAAGQFDDAEKWLLESARLRPDRIAENLGGADSTKRGILLVADRFVGKDLGAVVRIYRAAAEVAFADLDILNNLGLFARDHGNAVERGGNQAAAMKLYEISYEAYTKANQLDPDNVRLANDRALMMIYHLDRDWDESRRLLDRAIAIGDEQLKEKPPDNAQERQNLEEAVGDCYENLALWHLRHSKDAAAAKAAANKSMQYYPGQQRPGARRHIRAAEAMGK